MRKTISVLLAAAILFAIAAGCGAPVTDAETPIRIVTTIFPLYDWVRVILGDSAPNTELVLLQDSGVDLHSYQPTVDDIVAIAACDLFIYVGGESDSWVADALAESTNPDTRVINLLDALGDLAKEEALIEGMEAEEEPEEVEYDEHIWLSLRNARALCGLIADTLAAIDPENSAAYTANAAAYDAALETQDKAYEEAAASAAVHTVLFADRFPFRYLADDYGLSCYAAFAGCSAETEASFETVVFLADKLDELGLSAILQTESADGSIARTIRENTRTKDQKILTMDSLQSFTAADADNGASYLSVMEENLTVLRAALSG